MVMDTLENRRARVLPARPKVLHLKEATHEMDWSSLDGATVLAQRIKAYWNAKGVFPTLTVLPVVENRDDFRTVYGIRSVGIAGVKDG